MDGNYSSTLDLRIPVADSIVFLDLPRRVTLPSVLARWLWRFPRTGADECSTSSPRPNRRPSATCERGVAGVHSASRQVSRQARTGADSRQKCR
jgi:hypothetical protein